MSPYKHKTITEYNHVFELDAESRSAADKFEAEHEARHADIGPTAIGGRYTFEFTPTSVGVFAGLHCATCGERIHLTEHVSW